MDELLHVSTLFLFFAGALVAYAALLVATGNKELLPYRAIHSIRGPEDVRRVGRIVIVVGVVIGLAALALRISRLV